MITSRTQTITPEYASELLTKNTLNRPVNQATVDDYAAQMEKGLWKLNGEPVIVSTTGNLLDGQHRLLACVKANVGFTTVITTGIDASNFDTIDTGKVRSAADVFNIVGISNAAMMSSIVSSYFNIKKNDYNYVDTRNATLRKLKISKHELCDFYQRHSELVDRVYHMSRACYDHLRLLTTATIGAYALYLILDKKHPEEKVFSFFRELFGILPPTNNTVSLLNHVLSRHVLKQNVLTPLQKSVYIKKAWNNYVLGRELKSLTYNKNTESQLQFI